ncbi:MAG TPA: hypothetical protein VLA16_15105 [Ideonella sp.]|nr:hypothetical protein [Ideonella sp.]
MKIKELAEKAKAAYPGSLGSLPDAKINLLARTIFGLIKDELESTAEGSVKIAFLGQFKVRNVEIEKEGEKVQHRRIQFLPAAARVAAEGDKAEAADAEGTDEGADSTDLDADDDIDAEAGELDQVEHKALAAA